MKVHTLVLQWGIELGACKGVFSSPAAAEGAAFAAADEFSADQVAHTIQPLSDGYAVLDEDRTPVFWAVVSEHTMDAIR